MHKEHSRKKTEWPQQESFSSKSSISLRQFASSASQYKGRLVLNFLTFALIASQVALVEDTADPGFCTCHSGSSRESNLTPPSSSAARELTIVRVLWFLLLQRCYSHRAHNGCWLRQAWTWAAGSARISSSSVSTGPWPWPWTYLCSVFVSPFRRPLWDLSWHHSNLSERV